MNIKTHYARNENVLVARSDGTWSKAVVVNVDEDKKNYVVVFHDAGAGKSVQKQISFETAMFHLKEDSGGAYTRLDKKTHRLIDEIASLSLRNKIPFLDATYKMMQSRGSVPMINPAVQGSFSPSLTAALEEMLLYLSTAQSLDPERPVSDIAAWCRDNENKSPGLPSAVPQQQQQQQPTEVAPEQPASSLGDVISNMMHLKEKIHDLSQIGSPSEEVMQELSETKSEFHKLKLDVIASSKQNDPPEKATRDFFCAIVREGDQHENSAEVVDALLYNCSSIDFSPTINSENLLIDCCTDGNVTFLKQLLGYKNITSSDFDCVELFSSACFSQTARIQCVKVLLESSLVDLSPVIEDLKPVIEEYFSDITSAPKRLPKESRDGVEVVVERFLTHPQIATCNLSTGGTDPLSFLARTCRDGDLGLYRLCISHIDSPSKELMEPLPDGFTPFMHAIIKGQKELVAEVLSTQKLDLDKDTETGTCLGIANALQLDEISELLKTAGATSSIFKAG